MKTFAELESQIKLWADKRGLLIMGTKEAQADKTLEEAQELKSAIYQGDKNGIIDGIGDTLVTLIIQAELNDLNIVNCLESAWFEIMDRQGFMQDGQFVKYKSDI